MNNSDLVCPVCDRGQLAAESYSDDYQHNGKPLIVEDLERYRCSACGADPVFPDQIRRNQVRICDAKRRVDGLLSGAEIRGVRELLGLSQSDAAAIFGGGANAFSKYERGEVVQNVSMDRLLRCVGAVPQLMLQLRMIAGPANFPASDGISQQYLSSYEYLSLHDTGYTSKLMPGSQISVSREEKTSSFSLPRWGFRPTLKAA